jgi:hypothetical protein
MIERQTIKGREATVAYITDDFEPTTKGKATLVKVIFDDGDTLYLVPKKAGKDFNPNHEPAGSEKGGQFAEKQWAGETNEEWEKRKLAELTKQENATEAEMNRRGTNRKPLSLEPIRTGGKRTYEELEFERLTRLEKAKEREMNRQGLNVPYTELPNVNTWIEPGNAFFEVPVEKKKRKPRFSLEPTTYGDFNPNHEPAGSEHGGEFAEGDTGSPEHIAAVKASYDSLPDGVKEDFAKSSITVAAPTFVTQAVPRLLGERPPGWPRGATWNWADGGFFFGEGKIVVAEKTLSYKKERPARPVNDIFLHESGHAWDWAARALDGESTVRRLSSTKAFRSAYEADRRMLSKENRRNSAYYLQGGDQGAKEVFAESFSQALGGGISAPMAQRFPASFQHVKRLIQKRMGVT